MIAIEFEMELEAVVYLDIEQGQNDFCVELYLIILNLKWKNDLVKVVLEYNFINSQVMYLQEDSKIQ